MEKEEALKMRSGGGLQTKPSQPPPRPPGSPMSSQGSLSSERSVSSSGSLEAIGRSVCSDEGDEMLTFREALERHQTGGSSLSLELPEPSEPPQAPPLDDGSDDLPPPSYPPPQSPADRIRLAPVLLELGSNLEPSLSHFRSGRETLFVPLPKSPRAVEPSPLSPPSTSPPPELHSSSPPNDEEAPSWAVQLAAASAGGLSGVSAPPSSSTSEGGGSGGRFKSLRQKLKRPTQARSAEESIAISAPRDSAHVAHVCGSGVNLAAVVQASDFTFAKVRGSVARAVHTPTAYVLAIKRVTAPPRAELPESALQALAHPNLAAFYGSLRVGSEIWLLSEWCNVASVDDLVRMRRVAGTRTTADEIGALLRPVAAVLAHLHEHGVRHGHVRPQSILLTRSGRGHYDVRLSCFALAQPWLSVAAMALHDPTFDAPELVDGSEEQASAAADVWALGVTALCLANGDPAPFGASIAAVRRCIAEDRPQEYVAGVPPPALTAFISACLVRDPEYRPSARALLQLELLEHSSEEALRPLALNVTTLRTLKSHPPVTLRTEEDPNAPVHSTLPPPFLSTGTNPSTYAGNSSVSEKKSSRPKVESKTTRRTTTPAPQEVVIGAPSDFRKVDCTLVDLVKQDSAAAKSSKDSKDSSSKASQKSRAPAAAQDFAIGAPSDFRRVEDSERVRTLLGGSLSPRKGPPPDEAAASKTAMLRATGQRDLRRTLGSDGEEPPLGASGPLTPSSPPPPLLGPAHSSASQVLVPKRSARPPPSRPAPSVQ